MRSDMAKVCLEHERYDPVIKYSTRRSELKQELIKYQNGRVDFTTRENIRHWAIRGWNGKGSHHTIKPLKKFILKNIGKFWNDVRSEICHKIKPTSHTNARLRDWIFGCIEENTFVGEDGKVWHYPKWSSTNNAPEPIEKAYNQLAYVHPTTGCLEKIPKKPNHKYYRKVIQKIVVDKWHQIHYIHGFWYLVELKQIPDLVWQGNIHLPHKGYWYQPKYYDVAMNDIIDTWRKIYPVLFIGEPVMDVYGRLDVYANKRWQLNKKELKKYGLRNKL